MNTPYTSAPAKAMGQAAANADAILSIAGLLMVSLSMGAYWLGFLIG